ncbi:MAG: SusC/RagA family TonB-linked outer membrane protein [Bacteroidales bacterium]|nr:SusC/RagA family TonB-linked outer membrane protein [Bacteroides sp.]MCM1197456.1 SusC/RagA family TonB-linked outer membrane protein [Clostridium sp.]MCM1501178.1 SusC/RagA family TonB-linked outer membrane protein [Bacteroidales bacterium]
MLTNLSKIIAIAMCMLSFAFTAGAQKVSREFKEVPLKTVLEEIEAQTGCSFIFENSEVSADRLITATFSETPLNTVLSRILGPNLKYSIDGKLVTISKKVQQEKPATSRQKTTASGTVISALDNQPIIGAAVMVDNNASYATVTDIDGNWSLEIPAGASDIYFTCMGYETKIIPVKDLVLLKLVALSEQSSMLEDAVVVGFGVQKKETVVGAIQAVKPGSLDYPSSNLTASFAGKIAGVISTQTSGEPGADGANFWIRGISTFGTNTSPLIVLDGVEINTTMLNSIAPETIESFSVLKDATATALYGSRGANGVMIITTKNGKDMERMSINVRVENGWSMPTSVQEIADGVTYMEAFNEATGMQYYSQDKIDGTRAGLNQYVFPNNNWYKTLFKKSTMNQNVNVNVTGGGKRIDYFLNATFFNENGILRSGNESSFNTNINYKKFLFQSNVNAWITNTTKLGIRMNTQLHYRHAPYESVNNLFYYTMRSNPVHFPVTWPAEEDDTFVRYGSADDPNGGSNEPNPYALMNRGYSDRHYSYFTEVITLDQDLKFVTPGLKAKAQASFYNYVYAATSKLVIPHYYKLVDYSLNPETGDYDYVTSAIGASPQDYYSISTSRDGYREMSFQGSLEYTRNFAGKHDVNALLLYHQKEKVFNTPSATENEVLPYREQGLAGRVTYAYRNTYMFEANFGYNGSENFAKGKRFGFFPSMAIGYNISNEKFFRPVKDVLSLLKFRVSYGQSGNDALSVRFPYLTEVLTNQSMYWKIGPEFGSMYGTTIATLGNEDATWEVSTKLNVGIELGLFNDFTLIVDIFRDNRTGIFMQRRSVPYSAGYSDTKPWSNIGAVLNRGIDASFEYNKVFNKDLTFSARGSLTYAHNEITERDEPIGTPSYQSEIGHPINSVIGLVACGLFKDQDDIDSSPVQTYQTVRPGDIKYRDLNGDGKIDDNDMTIIGRPATPELVYGFGASVHYRHFDISVFFQGQALSSILMSNMHPFCDSGVSGFGLTQWIADEHWTASNPDTEAKYPRLDPDWNQNNTRTSTYWMRNGSFLRLKTAEIGYTWKWFRFYVTGSNLLTFTKFKYWDPGLGSGNGLSYPLQRTFNVGIQYNF